MTDDIVTRLRLSPITDASHIHGMFAEAADEIEDLRAELAEFQRQYQKLKKKYTDDCL